MVATVGLDTTERLSLALEAVGRQKYDDALKLLKELIAIAPCEARAHYLMGSVYAQIRLFDRAEAAFKEALAHDPALDAARFQLGLIYITSNRPVEAEETWRPLDARSEEDPLYLFKSGLLRLAQDDFAGCISLLERGMAQNSAFPSLNADMEKVLAKVRPQVSGTGTAKPGTRHVFLGQYGSGANDETEH